MGYERVDTNDGLNDPFTNDNLIHEEIDFSATGYMVAWRKYSDIGKIYSKRVLPPDGIETVANTQTIYPWMST